MLADRILAVFTPDGGFAIVADSTCDPLEGRTDDSIRVLELWGEAEVRARVVKKLEEFYANG